MGFEMPAFLQQAADAIEDGVHLRRSGLVTQSQYRVETEFVAWREVLEGHVRHLPVGNADHSSIGSSDSRRTEAYVLDRAVGVSDLYDVSHIHLAVENARNATEN